MIRNQEGAKLTEMTGDTFLTQIIKQSTRDSNLIDLVFVNEPDLMRG